MWWLPVLSTTRQTHPPGTACCAAPCKRSGTDRQLRKPGALACCPAARNAWSAVLGARLPEKEPQGAFAIRRSSLVRAHPAGGDLLAGGVAEGDGGADHPFLRVACLEYAGLAAA